MSPSPWYRRFPDNFIAGTVGLTLEEKGAYSLVLDLIYVRGGPVPDEARYIAGVCNCSVRKWKAIRQRLIDLGKIEAVDGVLLNHRAEKELENAAKTAQERAESGSKGGNKTAENAATTKKISNLAPAALKHTRASLNQNQLKKEGPSDLKEGQASPETIQLDRWADEQIFKACEALMQVTVPEYQQKKSFPADVVAQARKSA